MPFLLYLAIKTVIYLVFNLFGDAVGAWFFPAAAMVEGIKLVPATWLW
jgi:hypothetical protein